MRGGRGFHKYHRMFGHFLSGLLGVVIGKPCKNVKPEEALSYVLGYTCANDVSARDWQKEKGEGQFCRGKSFDTFCPVGPCLTTADEIPDPSKLTLRTFRIHSANAIWAP